MASWSMYTSPLDEPDFLTKRAQDMRSSSQFGQHKGFSSRQVGDSVIEMTMEGFDDPKFSFAISESIILACSNIDMKSYCMGASSECGIDGTKIIFSYDKPKVY